VYRPVPRNEIFDAVAHLRDLIGNSGRRTTAERYAFERRELVTKNLLSNLHRTGDHHVSMLLEIAMFEGAHRLFDMIGRDSRIRPPMNGGRTHIEG